ncbi:PEPxxWA-CTERM sorting domain-containing protein [Sandarakinorhabdus oryzae]|uniref:PEPxxWA-CTERM sorting domain-containing protein n=1 Tax=Sandarakinorhabdus oryzae TaxID=2675220 RepID=UPI0018CC603F|nr:PEPxxWA-CTERM sorting domain-containing protein [Sandarakinorhabdus oryzae]
MKMQFAVAVAAALVAMPALAVEQLTGGDFESPVIGSFSGDVSGTGYVYPALGGSATVGGWTYTGGAGLINGFTATPWFGGSPPQGFGGSQYAFVQSVGTLSQSFTATQSGVLTLSWLEGARPGLGCCNGNQTYDVLFGANQAGQFSTVSGQNFTARSLVLGPVTAGQSYSISFKGLITDDNTAFFDNISANITGGTVPEPASWMMLVTGFGLAGMLARRRRQRSVAA